MFSSDERHFQSGSVVMAVLVLSTLGAFIAGGYLTALSMKERGIRRSSALKLASQVTLSTFEVVKRFIDQKIIVGVTAVDGRLFYSYDSASVSSFPTGFTMTPGYLGEAQISQLTRDPSSLTGAEIDSLFLSSAKPALGDCSQAGQCITQNITFADATPGSFLRLDAGSQILLRGVATTDAASPQWGVPERVRVATSMSYPPAPPPSCTIVASSYVVYPSNTCTVLTVVPTSPGTVAGLITSTTVDGTTFGAGGGSVLRCLPWGYPEGLAIYYGGTVTGPGGTEACSPAPVYETCPPRAVDCTDNPGGEIECKYPVDNYPYCNDSIVCFYGPYGNGCFDRCQGGMGIAGECGGCFDATVRILMGDGKRLKRADQVREGDEVWNPFRHAPVKVKKLIAGPEKIPLYEIETSEGRVRVTATHPFYTRKGIRQAQELKAGEAVRTSELEFHSVTAVRRLALPGDRAQIVFNFLLDGPTVDKRDHSLVADGIVTGDFLIQTSEEKRRKQVHR